MFMTSRYMIQQLKTDTCFDLHIFVIFVDWPFPESNETKPNVGDRYFALWTSDKT